MKGIICYYSGTGNTRLVCQYIAKSVKGIRFDLFDMVTGGEPDLNPYEMVGLGTFADFYGPPQLFETFIEKLPAQKSKPAFVVNTYGGRSGQTLKIMGNLIASKGFTIIAGHSLHTPENYPPNIATGKGNEQAPNPKEMNEFDNFIMELNGHIKSLSKGQEIPKGKIRLREEDNQWQTYPRTASRDEIGKLYVDETLCTECGECEKLCPYRAIIIDQKPVFNMKACYGCWLCYNRCPEKAIYTEKYRGEGHYPEPIEVFKQKLNG